MKRCKHENAAHMMPGDSSTPDWLVRVYAECEQVRCMDCGEWLALDPAVDDGPTPEVREAVAIEIRAAEIAIRVIENMRRSRATFLSRLGCDGAEIAGWIIALHDSNKLTEQPGKHAGYLARIIYEHGKEGA